MKRLLTTLILVGLMLSAHAQTGGFSRAENNQAKVWNKYRSQTRKMEWRGHLDADGYATGRGVALFTHNDRLAAAYYGEMNVGRMDGDAVAIYPLTGLCYVGQLKDWSEHGYGVMRFADGSRYEGNWHDGLRHGSGLQWSPGGNIAYQGGFYDDQPTSSDYSFERSQQSLSSGAIVQKLYQSVQIHWYGPIDRHGMAAGFGIAVSSGKNGIAGIYHGLASQGKLDTNVVAIYANMNARMAYVGELQDWNEHGYGQMFYPDGSIFIGDWRNEQRHGEGYMISLSGKRHAHGIYEYDRLVSQMREPSVANSSAMFSNSSDDMHRYDEVAVDETRSHSQRQEQAIYNIMGMVVAQWGVDAIFDAENTLTGAAISLLSRHYIRSGVIDNNLRILLPDVPDPGIRLVRNLICSVCDGTLSVDNLVQRTARAEAVTLAKEIGTTEGQAAQLLLFLNDFCKRADKIQQQRQ
ncbi:hypothetical protein FEM03_07110 [Phragmitibacter flavus]|uniref:MORN repeat-containing protein n=1 Tax=Phragmitibacter flavus TaxID=2576071 RepID=A0A5R8KG61_9BACT|nr:hypothetical protein [Phragmitibacter flavus]TLD71292.1 hypothetical protein FEM03_07110 [Phragmitibacter flavus]